MNRTEAISKVLRQADHIRRLGVTSLSIFGSAARDELRDDSDIDVFVDYDPNGSFTFVELVRLQKLLSMQLNRNIDVTTRDGLHPRLRQEIERTSVKVF